MYDQCVLYWKNVVLGFVDYVSSKKGQFDVNKRFYVYFKSDTVPFHISFHRTKYSNTEIN